MHSPSSSNNTVENLEDLLTRSCVQAHSQKIGVEIEKIGMWKDGSPLQYASTALHPGAGEILRAFEQSSEWKPKRGVDDALLGFSTPSGSITLEPGSQLEFSGNACRTLPEVRAQVLAIESQIDAVTDPLGLRWLGVGVNPTTLVDKVDIIPLPRYRLMTDHFGQTGQLGTSMMRLTSSVQINVDYCSEETALEMLRASLAIAPLSYALFGNSPFYQGKESGWLSFRSEIWRNTDPVRCGLLPEAFEPSFSFRRYAERIWTMPLMYVSDAKGGFLPGKGKSLRDISEGAIPGVIVDSVNLRAALGQIFTESRLKMGYLEIRSIDGLPEKYRWAAVAFWVGLLYGEAARGWTELELGTMSSEERQLFWLEACREGLASASIRKVCERAIELSEQNLLRRGFGEEVFLTPLYAMLSEGKNPAQRLLTAGIEARDLWAN